MKLIFGSTYYHASRSPRARIIGSAFRWAFLLSLTFGWSYLFHGKVYYRDEPFASWPWLATAMSLLIFYGFGKIIGHENAEDKCMDNRHKTLCRFRNDPRSEKLKEFLSQKFSLPSDTECLLYCYSPHAGVSYANLIVLELQLPPEAPRRIFCAVDFDSPSRFELLLPAETIPR